MAVPRLAPSSNHWTLATATLSEAFALTVTEPDTVPPAAGAVTETVGGVVSVVLLVWNALHVDDVPQYI